MRYKKFKKFHINSPNFKHKFYNKNPTPHSTTFATPPTTKNNIDNIVPKQQQSGGEEQQKRTKEQQLAIQTTKTAGEKMSMEHGYTPVEYAYILFKYLFPGAGTKFVKDLGAGAAAACIAKTVIAPVERVKLILQLQASQETIAANRRYKGMVDCFLRIPKEQGFLSFWRGNVSNVLRAASQESIGIASKEMFRRYFVKDEHKNTNYQLFLAGNLLAGGLAGVFTFFFIYPLDFSRTRLAVDMGKDPASREFRGLVDCFIKLARKDGLEGLYRGFLPSIQYIFLYRAAYYGLFDSFKVFASKSGSTTGKDVSFGAALAIGQVSALVAALISYPLDTVRRRLMMQSGRAKPEYYGTKDCFKKIYRTEGTKAFFHGFMVNAIRGFGAALVLAIYNDLSKYIHKEESPAEKKLAEEEENPKQNQ